MNFRSASLRAVSDHSPVQIKEWQDSQSASAHDVLQELAKSSEVVNLYFMLKWLMCKIKCPNGLESCSAEPFH